MLKLHPLTMKALKSGHPWVTKDQFTAKFPKDQLILYTPAGILLHDPTHPWVKAHLWPDPPSPPAKLSMAEFKHQIKVRLRQAVQKRQGLAAFQERQNIYLVFGQADGLPGLMLLQLGRHFIWQAYAFFWEKFKQEFVADLAKIIKEFNLAGASPASCNIFWETRQTPPQPRQLMQGSLPARDIIEEYGIRYHIDLMATDFGIYTDMAALRPKLLPFLRPGCRVLNLYAYTGAFSLFALKAQAQVVSVDLSREYLQQLENNLALNPELAAHQHTSLASSVQKALPQLIAQQAKFDLIIVDPPSASSNGQQKTSAWQTYPKLLPLLDRLLANEGKVVTFLNTHKISYGKFKTYLTKHITALKLPWQALQLKLTLTEDCPTLPHFAEGNYLKGIVWLRTTMPTRPNAKAARPLE